MGRESERERGRERDGERGREGERERERERQREALQVPPVFTDLVHICCVDLCKHS